MHNVSLDQPLRVTFDSNAYRQAVDPTKSRRDATMDELEKINDALRDGRIKGFLSETLATLEGIQNAQRGAYFSKARARVDIEEEELPDGRIKVGFVVGADDSLHPGLHPIVARWIAAATALGLKFLYTPRIGQPRPSELLSGAPFEIEATSEEREARQERFFAALAAIEARGVGFSVLKRIADNIQKRTQQQGPWFSILQAAKDQQEHTQIQKAVGEWADGDTVAAHIAYRNDLICVADKGKSAGGASIFDDGNRGWLEQTYGVQFVTLSELAGKLR